MVLGSLQNVIASVLIGLDKGGIPGFGALGMALALGASNTDNIGHILAIFAPVLMLADIGAIIAYFKDVNFRIVLELAASITIGMLFGFIFLGNTNELLIRHMTGAALLFLSILFYGSKLCRSHISKLNILPHSHSDKLTTSFDFGPNVQRLCSVCVGICTGALTVVANVAGPIIAIYFIQLELPKRQLNGTRALLFLCINLVKIPAQVYLGNFELSDVSMVVPLALIGMISTFCTERFLMPFVNQTMFENVAWLLVAVGAIKLVLA